MDPDYLDSLVKRGVISDDAAARMTGGADLSEVLTGQPQRQSRWDMLRDALTPGYFRDTPSSPQADRALADPNARPGKIGPPSGPPTGMQIAGGLAGDVGLNALPIGKLAPALGMANPTPMIVGKVKVMVDEMIARGESKNTIAKAAGTGTATIGRYLAKSGQKTAAAENPSVWTPETEAQLIAYRRQGVSHPDIAQKMGLSFRQVESKVYALKDAGRIPDDVPRWEPFVNDPKKTAEFVKDVDEGWSQGALNRKYGWDERGGMASMRIKQLKERGDIKNYVPQGGTGLTPAGRTPTVVQTKTQSRPPPGPEDLEAGRDFANAMRAFLPQSQ
jgi:hypothetical protein